MLTTTLTETIYDFVKEAEKRLLHIIQEGAERLIISAEDAVQIAKDFLTLLPVLTWRELCKKLEMLSKIHQICLPLYVQFAISYEDITSRKKAALLNGLLQSNEIDKAYALMKGGIL